jgi:hypothetical protein
MFSFLGMREKGEVFGTGKLREYPELNKQLNLISNEKVITYFNRHR